LPLCRSERHRHWLGAVLALLPIALFRAGSIGASDTFWEIRTGQLILDRGALPTHDTLSWTAAGWPWRINSWGFDVLAALAYRAGGLAAVALLSAALLMTVYVAALTLTRRLGGSPGLAALLFLVSVPAWELWLSARPQLIDYAAVPLLLVLLAVATDPGTTGPRQRALAVAGIAGLHVVWVNLHAAALLGVVVTALFAVTRPGLWRWGGAALLAAVAGTVLNPYGVGVLGQTQEVRAASSYILEWTSLRPSYWDADILLALALLAGVVAWRTRRYALMVVLAALAVGGVFMIRLLPVAAVIAIPVLATAAELPRLGEWLRARAFAVRAILATAVAGMVAVAAIAVTHVGRSAYPLAALDALPSGCRLLNDYTSGGPVTLFRPDVPVSVDSRNDLYGEVELARQSTVLSGPPYAPARLADWGVTCVLVKPSTGIVPVLRRTPGWREAYTDERAVVFVHDAAPA
jgi:hypothetical protein